MEGTCRAGERAPGRYQRRRPSQSALYHCVQEHLATWLAHSREGYGDDGSVPAHVEREFRRYLECCILAHGFGLWSEFHGRTEPCVRPLTPFSKAALEQVLRQVRVEPGRIVAAAI